MSTYEIRIDCLDFNTSKKYDEIQAFSIGHESCIIKFFKIIQQPTLQNFIKQQKNAGKQIRIITPFVPEQHIDEMKEIIKKICSIKEIKDSVIIINDLGLMSFIHRIDKDRHMCLGRSLCVCFDYAPWGCKIYENEQAPIQKIVSQVSFFDDEKMAFFKYYNISEIEVNITERTVESLKNIQNAGFKINVHQSSLLYGLQRSCYIRRTCPEHSCSGMECDHAQKLELEKLWCGQGFYETTEDISFPSPLYLRGNQIYSKACELSCDWADQIIVNPE